MLPVIYSHGLLERVPKLKVAAVIVLFLVIFFYVPVVPYIQPITVPGSYSPGFEACLAGVSQTNLRLAMAQQLNCENEFRAPAVDLYGFATPAYGLLGYGAPPFPSQELVSQGNHSVIVYFNGSQVAAVEDAGPAGVMVNPQGVLYIQDAEVISSDYGFLNITIQLRNLGNYPVSNPSVYLSMVGYSSNATEGSVTLIKPKFVGNCEAIWAPADYCVVSQVAPNNLPVNKSFSFYPEVRGSVEGRPFLYREGFWENYPQGGVGPLWVKEFMSQVDRARGGTPMTENATLDRFAAIRFKDASAEYQISDYGFTADAASFFSQGVGKGSVVEVLLYPGVFSPDTYPNFLSEYAIGHWYGLTNPAFTKYGYYVGQALYYDVSIPCPVYEIPGPGINITQFFLQHGCTTTVASTTWLVIILST